MSPVGYQTVATTHGWSWIGWLPRARLDHDDSPGGRSVGQNLAGGLQDLVEAG